MDICICKSVIMDIRNHSVIGTHSLATLRKKRTMHPNWNFKPIPENKEKSRKEKPLYQTIVIKSQSNEFSNSYPIWIWLTLLSGISTRND